MVGPGFGHKNFQELISNSIQLLGEHPRKASPSGSNALRAPLEETTRCSANSATTPKKSRRVLRHSIGTTLRIAKYMDRISLWQQSPINVGSKLFDLLIPKAIAVVEMDVTETSVLKLFDQSIVSCEFVNELCPHLRPLHREDSSVFPLRLDSDVVTPFQKRLLQVFGQPNPIQFRRNGRGNSGGCRSGQRGCGSSYTGTSSGWHTS